MNIPSEIKKQIFDEYNQFKDIQYGSNTKEQREELDQFYTPPELTIKLIEKLENLNGTICDPTCGAGGLLAAAIIAGADPANCYGNEYDANIVEICRQRLVKCCLNYTDIKDKQKLIDLFNINIHQGDALRKYCIDIENFNKDYDPNKKDLSEKDTTPADGFGKDITASRVIRKEELSKLNPISLF